MNLPTCAVTSRCKNTCPPGTAVCSDCANELGLSLLYVPLIAGALEDAHVKGQRFGTTSVALPNPDESPVPFSPRASDARAELLAALTQAADAIASRADLFRPLDTFRALSRFLASQVSWIRVQHDGPAMVRHLTGVLTAASRVVDRPADVVMLGHCNGTIGEGIEGRRPGDTCGVALYAPANRPEVTCRTCLHVHQAHDRRAWLLGEAEEVTLPAAALQRAIDGLGVDVTPKQIMHWAARGRLEPAGSIRVLGRDRPTYRVGDVLDIVNADRRRRDAAQLQLSSVGS
jgi:hypothetical protein